MQMEDFPSICQHSDQREACANFNSWPTARLLPAQNLGEFVKNQPVSQNLRTEVFKKYIQNQSLGKGKSSKTFRTQNLFNCVDLPLCLGAFSRIQGCRMREGGEGRSRDLPS